MFHPRPLQGVSSTLPVRPSPERSPPKLCDNGRAFVTDPNTGQLVCLCQVESHHAHGMQSHPALRGIRTLHSPRPGFGDIPNYHAQFSAMTSLTEQSNGLLPPHIAFHPYGAMYAGMDMNGGAMRKAATRETTGPLKAWLSEHKKNPYPTKAEKIMLAIITRMTLTQVSTWFANARRRLKKDNRLTSGEGEDDSVGIDSDREGDSDSVSADVTVGVDQDVKTVLRENVKLSSEGEADPDSFSDISDDESDVFRLQSRDNASATSGARVPVITSAPSISQSDTVLKGSTNSTPPAESQTSEKTKTKPKIWSISHILDS